MMCKHVAVKASNCQVLSSLCSKTTTSATKKYPVSWHLPARTACLLDRSRSLRSCSLRLRLGLRRRRRDVRPRGERLATMQVGLERAGSRYGSPGHQSTLKRILGFLLQRGQPDVERSKGQAWFIHADMRIPDVAAVLCCRSEPAPCH